LQGEEVIREIDCKYLIFRTSWVFAARGTNFINTVLRLAKQRKELHIVADQVGSPTSADLIADITSLALYKLIHQEMATEPLTGTYHLAADGNTTWHGLATYVVTQALEFGSGLQTVPATVQPIATSDYPLPANRPANSCFNTEKLNRTFDLKLPPWQDGIDRILGEILNS
jgi:dTDP-4-dehydrorhamnose reductase